MKIGDVRIIPLSYPTDDTPPRLRSFALVRVETDEGLVGWGEASDCYGHRHPLTVQALVDEHLRWLFVDGDPMDAERLMEQARQQLFRTLGARELVVQTLSGIEIALWDLRGQAIGAPVSEMLGRQHDTIPIYAAGRIALHDDPGEHVEFLRPLLERGVGAVKIRTGRDLEWDGHLVRSVRAGLPDDVDLFVDGKYNYFPDSAVRFSHVLAEAEVGFFEEPIVDLDLSVLRGVNERSAVPLAYGEHSFGVHGFRELLIDAALTIVEPDATVCGGIGEARKIADLAEALGARVVPHCGGLTAIGIAANLHFTASLADPTLLEFDARSHQPLRDRLSADSPFSVDAVEDGRLAVPTGPGLGITVNEAALDEYPYVVDASFRGRIDTYAVPHI